MPCKWQARSDTGTPAQACILPPIQTPDGHTLDASQFLEYYGLPQHGISKREYLGIEMLFFIMFFVLAWLALKYKKHGNR